MYKGAMASAVAQSQHPISVEDYLEGERFSEVRHEFVAGRVYAMAGASVDHNRITLNLLAELRERLRGKRCEPFGSDMKLKMPGSEAFYYPDALVTCDPADDAKYFREKPVIVFEVLSQETERTDQREKRFAYSLIPSLKVYVLISQEKREISVLRRGRTEQWVSESVTGRDALLELPEIKVEIPLVRIYERTAAARLKA
jgi:Uma2 family endonuclease